MMQTLPIVENLHQEKICAVIEPENFRYLSRLEIVESIDSTNTYLLNCAKAGAASGFFCFAEEQTQGRGRRGRMWFSPRGWNIYGSLLWRFEKNENLSGLSIAIGVMVVNALRKYGIAGGLQLKWPNDVLFAGRKLAGILLERNEQAVVIGIGLNLYLPPEADAKWIAVQELTGQAVKRNFLVGLLVNELLLQLPIYQARGLQAFIDEWRRYDVLQGEEVVVQTATENFYGVMQGVNEQGELLLKNKNGEEYCFNYGEVSVRHGG